MKRSDAVQAIHALERKHEIFSIQREGMSVWELICVSVVVNLVSEANYRTNEGRLGTIKKKLQPIEINTLKKVINSKKIRSKAENKETVLFMLRGKYSNGKDDLLHEYIEKYQKEKKYDTFFIDRRLDGELSPNIYNAEYDTYHFRKYGKFFAVADIFQWTEEELETIENFYQDLLKLGYYGMPIRQLLEIKLKDFYIEKYNYSILIKAQNIKFIFLSLAYTHLGLIAAAKECGVKTVEIQYANISNMHLGFNFAQNTVINPDFLVLWSDIYTSSVSNNKAKLLVKCPEAIAKVESKKKDQLLVIVQKVEYEAFLKIAEPLRKSNPNLPIIFKLPQGINFSRDYLKKLKNWDIQIFEWDSPKSTMEFIKESKWVISGYSTALIEAVAQGAITISDQSIPNSEEFRRFIDLGIMFELEDYSMKAYQNQSRANEAFNSQNIDAIIEVIENER